MKKVISAIAGFMALAASAEPVIDKVVVRQLWPWSTDIRIDYTLSGAESPVDINLEFKDGEEPLAVAPGSAAIQGDVYYVDNGVRTVTVDPVAAFGSAKKAFADFKVRISPTAASALPDNKVLYKVVDLENGKVTDITRADLLLRKYGAFETEYSKIGKDFTTPLSDVVIWTGVTNNPVYKTTKMVLRRIPAGTFNMGSPEDEQYRDNTPIATAPKVNETQHSVTLTKDFWIGVFPVTQAQYALMTGETEMPMSKHGNITSGDAGHNPVYDLTYTDIRGSNLGENWPPSHDVDAGSVLGKLRAIFGGTIVFDLPTEAQWEYACRGGNEGANILYSGKPLYKDGEVQAANRNELSWNYFTASSRTRPVGGKAANPYGLYDMLGNVCEWVLDSAADFTSDPVTNPVGASKSTTRIVRGGDVAEPCGRVYSMRSAFRFGRNQSTLYAGVIPGFRVCVTEE